MKKYFLILLMIPAWLLAEVNSIHSSQSTARAVALGGAYTSVCGNYSSTIYNPAALEMYKYPKRRRFTFYLNPLGSYSAVQQKKSLTMDSRITNKDWLAYAGMIVKSTSLSTGPFAFSALFSEPLKIQPDVNVEMLNSFQLLESYYHVVSGRLKLSDKISIGASSFIFSQAQPLENKYSYGASYGVMFKSSKHMTVGVSYFDFPDSAKAYMTNSFRFIDDSINIGLSLFPVDFWMISVDVRNVTENGDDVTQEFHVGSEMNSKFLSLRGGWFKDSVVDENYYSLGIGLLSNDYFRKKDNHFNSQDFILNYSIQTKSMNDFSEMRHFMTLAIRI